eukprot:g25878.t1
MAVPKLVVFDLDACCWYPEMYMLRRGAPFAATSDPNVLMTCGKEKVRLLGDEGVSMWDVAEKGHLVEIFKSSKQEHFRRLAAKTGQDSAMIGSSKLSEKQKAALERLRERALKPPPPKEEPKEEKPKTEGAALGFLGEKRWEKGRMLKVCLGLVAFHVKALNFDDYLQRYGKDYDDPEEYAYRKALFDQRAARIDAQNAMGTWKAGFNDFTDATPEELKRMMGYRKERDSELRGAVSSQAGTPRLKAARAKPKFPKNLDWRERTPSVVSPVKSQGGCGSCWAFAAAEVIESHVAIKTGVLLSLSPQELTSCTPNPRRCGGTGGCAGAMSQLAFDYIKQQGGVSDIWQYPYLSGTKYASLECEAFNGTVYWPPKASITGHALMEAVQLGPVTVSVDASDWWLYHGGIFDGCNKTHPDISHAVDEKGQHVKYWLIRNSWGTMFGENGYIRLRRYDDEPCGYDPHPLQGTACEVGGPEKVYACGECGVLADSSYPLGAALGRRGQNLDVDY